MTQRIISFLPSATELLFELGAQDMLYGVTHECLYPEDAKKKPRIITSVIDPEKLDSKEIDVMTSKLLKEGKDIFKLNKENLKNADPNLIVTQTTCEVCAAHTNLVQQAVESLEKKPQIHSMDPHNLSEILQSVKDLAEIIGVQNKGQEICKSLEQRLEKIQNTHHEKRHKVLAIEWIEPFFTAGHWVPQMIEYAGGINMISKIGEHSRRMDLDEIINADPDMIILMPCGFDTKRTIEEYNKFLSKNQRWNNLRAVKDQKVFAVDANSCFSKPSIRTITGVEILAKIIHPEKFAGIVLPENSHANIKEF